jgi:hypothetical protein
MRWLPSASTVAVKLWGMGLRLAEEFIVAVVARAAKGCKESMTVSMPR